MIRVKACLNGRRTRAEHEAVPLTPEELARDAAAVASAGAFAVHVHPRGGDGAETLDADACAAAVAAICRAVPGLPVGLSTGAWISDDRLRDIGGWRVLPDFVSVNFSEPGTEELCELLLARGIGIEAGLASPADAAGLVRSGLGPRCVRVLVEVDGGVDDAEAVDRALAEAGIAGVRLWHGDGAQTWAVVAAGLARGYEVRIGLEDTLVLPDGSRAGGNAELVAAVSELARSR
jgi:uncharacterized protein (DUF849 family)